MRDRGRDALAVSSSAEGKSAAGAWVATAALSAALACGCATESAPQPPPVAPATFEHRSGAATAAWPAQDWYRGFGSEELNEFVARHIESYWHPVGTCAMGVHQGAVVDPSLCVYGTTNLRVADASIMPTITTGNTNAPTIVIAERAARMIMERRTRSVQ